MTCEELTEFLSRYIDGDLDANEFRVFEGHLGMCPPCEVYLDTFRETIRMGKAVSCPEAQEAMPERLVAAILKARAASKPGSGE